jgi:hypothetical protein
MPTSPTLTDEQVADFKQDGYVVVPGAFDTADAARRIYFATYNRASEGDHLEKYYADKRKNFPPDIEREDGRVYTYKV